MADMKYDIDVSEVVQARREIQKWAKDNSEAFNVVNSRMRTMGKTSELAFNQFGRSASRAQTKWKRFSSVGLQQAGYQIGDFAVQLQGGTNAAVAFGQQGSQLAGIFGPAGAIAGAGIAITTAFVAPLLDASKAASNAQENVDKFTSALKDFRDIIEMSRMSTGELREEFGDFADEVERTSELLSNIAVSRAFDALNTGSLVQIGDELEAAVSSYQNLVRAQDAFISGEKGANGELLITEDILKSIEDQALGVSDKIGLLPEQASRFSNMLSALKSADNLSSVRDRSQEILDYFSGLVKEGERIDPALAEALETIGDIRGAAARATSGLDDMAKGAGRLADNLRDATSNTAQMMTMLGQGFAVDPQGFMRSGQGIVGEVSDPEKPKRSSRGGSSRTPKDPREFLEELEREIELKRLLVGVNEAQAERLKIEARLKEQLLETGGKVTEADRERIAALVKQSEAIRKAEEAEERRRANIERFENQMSDSITNVVKEAQSIEDAFIGVIRNIVEELFRQNVAQPIASGIGDFIGGIFGGATPNANGNAFSGGRVTAFADGGVVSKPTMFPMANGTGLMGEAGPEAIMPLKRGKGGKLGVAAEGGSSGPVTVNNHFHIAANGDDSVRRIIQSEAPKISAMTEKQIINSRRRGGSLKQAFG